MKVMVDTSVWSLALRRGGDSGAKPVEELRSLIADKRVQMIGAIRQEILSGIREEAQFKELETRLSAFPDLQVDAEDYVTAARFFNACRAKGIQGSNTDFLICAVAVRHRLAIFTTDKDFARYARHLPIVLHG
ncbi:PIN domain-containing protein [Candidatus Eisenbacteria bacterium]|uniref:Ribonuclease VapC n=1 Tax=Eiseniibacteriota bacterium TaxID=2212470 RepID=A0ABV6YN55_UNCEI